MNRLIRVPGLLALLFAALYVGNVDGFVRQTLYHDFVSTGSLYIYLPATPREWLATIMSVAMFALAARALYALCVKAQPFRNDALTFAVVAVGFGVVYQMLRPLPEAIFLVPETLVGDPVNQDLRFIVLDLPAHQFDYMALVLASVFMSAMTMLSVRLDSRIHSGYQKMMLRNAANRPYIRDDSGTGYADELRASGPHARSVATQ